MHYKSTVIPISEMTFKCYTRLVTVTAYDKVVLIHYHVSSGYLSFDVKCVTNYITCLIVFSYVKHDY